MIIDEGETEELWERPDQPPRR